MGESGYRRPESVLVVVYTAAGEVLLIKRRQPVDFWQSVTGSLELNELPLQAAYRELAEETGIVPASVIDCRKTFEFEINSRWRRRYAPGVTINTEHWFLCELPEKPETIALAADEHTQYQWLSVEKAVDTVSSRSNRAALKEFVVPRLSL
ncbi:dihydroneopterin triphosphate diphosphatase [Chromatiales bacterium (ex Bugula neritina AB1)]|nr:dihydroneopterin triphosphate diphosphatase [Chromatiales bacterium (ex Bugula neritina AB1)]